MPQNDMLLAEQARIKFDSAFQLLTQQMTSKIWTPASFTANSDIANNREVWLNDIANKPEFTETTGQRFGQHQPTATAVQNRRLHRQDFDYSHHWDRKDWAAVDQAANGQSEVMSAIMAAWARKLDSIAIEKAVASVTVNRTAPESLAFPSGNVIAVNFVRPGQTAANSGLTPDKLLEVKRRMTTADVDLDRETICVIIGPQQEMDMVQYIAASPNDAWAKMFGAFLETGMGKVFGMELIRSNRLRDVGSNTREVLAFTKSAFTGGAAKIETKFDVIATGKHKLQLAIYAEAALVRARDEKVYPIYCKEVF